MEEVVQQPLSLSKGLNNRGAGVAVCVKTLNIRRLGVRARLSRIG